VPIFDLDSDTVTGPVVPGAPTEPELHVDEIQGNVFPGFGTRRQRLFGLKFDPAQVGAVRKWLAGQVGSISTLAHANDARNARRRALRQGQPRPLAPLLVNIAFSIGGLRLLAPAVDGIGDTAFVTGMSWRSGLGDPGAPGNRDWVVGGSEATTPDALVILGADSPDDLDQGAAALLGSLAASGGAVRSIYDQLGEVLEGETEHFGFRDGISQPGPRGRLSGLERHFLIRRYVDPADPLALSHSRPGQPLVWPGQFVFGYRRQDPDEALAAGPVRAGAYPWMADGSFLVFRRLRQDVALFRTFVSEQAAALRTQPGFSELRPERLAAAIVGRWPKGTALMRNAAGDDPDPMGDRLSVNHFGFAEAAPAVAVCSDPLVAIEELAEALNGELRTIEGAPADPTGDRCPRFAHVRKVNPRDLTTDQNGPDRTLTLTILRRGITWGAPYPDDPAPADSGDRGLLFLAYMTSITNQFEILNDRWMNRAAGPEGGANHDLLVGQSQDAPRSGTLRSGRAEAAITPGESWVTPTGGGYFFAPSISALESFAAG